jgi:hypothetical protein
MTDNPITVTALSRSRTFSDLSELASFVEEVVENRGGLYDPFEVAAIQKLATVANGQASSDVHRIAKNTTFHSPRREPRPPTPFDQRIAEAEDRLESKEEEWLETRKRRRGIVSEGERLIAAAREKGGTDAVVAHRVRQVRGTAQQKVADSDEVVEVARKALTRARARRNALTLAADRWRYEQTATFHNAADPSKPLTLADLDK